MVMMSEPTTPIREALEGLIEELDALFDRINQDIQTATFAADYDRVASLANDAKAVKQYRSSLNIARRSLDGLALPPALSKLIEIPKVPRISLNKGTRATKGVGKPQSAYYLVILKVLEEMGGQGSKVAVMDQVHELLQNEFTEEDYAELVNSPGVVRWKNRVGWAGHSLRKQGFLEPVKKSGVWVISGAGRTFLNAAQELSNEVGVETIEEVAADE
jgi:Mrr N-terminal domain